MSPGSESTPFLCPGCGGEVPAKARACPHCGSDENTGWSETAYLSELGVDPYDEDDYQETLQRELGLRSRGQKIRNIAFTFLAILVISLFFYFYVCRG